MFDIHCELCFVMQICWHLVSSAHGDALEPWCPCGKTSSGILWGLGAKRCNSHIGLKRPSWPILPRSFRFFTGFHGVSSKLSVSRTCQPMSTDVNSPELFLTDRSLVPQRSVSQPHMEDGHPNESKQAEEKHTKYIQIQPMIRNHLWRSWNFLHDPASGMFPRLWLEIILKAY